MYPTVSFNEEELLGRLLDVFESNEKFAPTHWGNCETVRVEYNRQEIRKSSFRAYSIRSLPVS